MANYKETTGSASMWRRCKQVIINNAYQATKQIMFMEEDIVVLDGRIIKNQSGTVFADYIPDYLINLRDPATGEKTGNTIPESLVYQALYSLYLDMAENRDAQPDTGRAAADMTPAPMNISPTT
jgi:hypothetical protein